MIERGLIDGVVTHAHDRGSSYVAAAHINRLTWEGHDFLAAARSDTVWNKSKAVFVSKGVPATIELMKTVLMAEAKKALGLP